MKQLKTIEIVTITSGLLELTADQARRRSHLIQEVPERENVYEVLQPCTFKAGEEFGFEGDMYPGLAKFFEGEHKRLQNERSEKHAKNEQQEEESDQGELKDDDQDLIDAIIENITLMDPDEDYRAGKPRVGVLKELTGRDDVTQKAIDAALEQMNGD